VVVEDRALQTVRMGPVLKRHGRMAARLARTGTLF
jgi:hypothetical protein